MPVLVAEGDAREATVLELNELKGSLISPDGDVSGVEMLRGLTLVLLKRRLLFAEVGEARRDRVLRKFDLRFGGGAGSDCMSMGRAGNLTPGWDSRSLWSSSTSSFAVRVRVRLCVGARRSY